MLLIIRVMSFPRLQASCVQPAACLLARKRLANSSTIILPAREGVRFGFSLLDREEYLFSKFLHKTIGFKTKWVRGMQNAFFL